jgi:hypothetical protein
VPGGANVRRATARPRAAQWFARLMMTRSAPPAPGKRSPKWCCPRPHFQLPALSLGPPGARRDVGVCPARAGSPSAASCGGRLRRRASPGRARPAPNSTRMINRVGFKRGGIALQPQTPHTSADIHPAPRKAMEAATRTLPEWQFQDHKLARGFFTSMTASGLGRVKTPLREGVGFAARLSCSDDRAIAVVGREKRRGSLVRRPYAEDVRERRPDLMP